MIYIVSVLFPLGLIIIGNIFFRWRFGVILIFVWFFIGDVIRKIIPGQPSELVLIGDALLLFTYISFFAFLVIKRKTVWTPPFLGAFLLFLFIVTAGIFNPSLPSFATSLIGFRSYIWFIPLIFIGYAFFDNQKNFLKFCRILVMLAIPLFLFALIGAVLGDSAPLVIKPFETAHQFHSFGTGIGIGGRGNVDKISSIFGTDQRYGMVSLFIFLLGLGISVIEKKIKPLNKKNVVGIVCAFLGTILSGSRSAFVLAVLGFFLFVLITQRHFLKKQAVILQKFIGLKKAFFMFIFLILILFVVYITGENLGLFQIDAFFRIFNSRMILFVKEMQNASRYISVFGNGTGTFAQGLQEIGQFEKLNLAVLSGGETGAMRLFFELGFVGFIVFYGFWIKIFIHIKNYLKKVNNPDLDPIIFSISIFIFLCLLRFTFVHHQVLGDSAILILIWFFIGALFKIKSLK